MSTSLRRGSETRRNLCGKNVEPDRQAFIQRRINEAQKEARKLLGDGATAHSRANRPDHKLAGAHLGRTVREKVKLNWISNNKNVVRAAFGGQTIALLPRNRRKLVGIACEQTPDSPSIAGERR